MGGAGSAVCEALAAARSEARAASWACPTASSTTATRRRLLASVGLDAAGIEQSIPDVMSE